MHTQVVDDVATQVGALVAVEDLGNQRDLDPVDLVLARDLLAGVHRWCPVVHHRRIVIHTVPPLSLAATDKGSLVAKFCAAAAEQPDHLA